MSKKCACVWGGGPLFSYTGVKVLCKDCTCPALFNLTPTPKKQSIIAKYIGTGMDKKKKHFTIQLINFHFFPRHIYCMTGVSICTQTPSVIFSGPVKMFINHSDVDVYFTRDDFRASESEQSIPIRVGKSRKIATPLSLRLRPAEVPEVTSTGDVSEGTCPDMCTCECQLNPDLYGKHDRPCNKK